MSQSKKHKQRHELQIWHDTDTTKSHYIKKLGHRHDKDPLD